MMVFAGELRVELSRIRRDLHQYPQLFYDVFRTSKLVADLLESWGIEVRRRNVGRHFGMGVVGTLHAGSAINVIAAHSELTGTFRAYRKDIVATITEGLRRLAASIADQVGGSYKLELREGDGCGQ
ncbi:hypothetical protein SAMN04488688_10729 [Paenibacillus sp. cl141a]|nr:hypothetical protein SAMN04488688_10729 [Paenibacillus sp. cl141a]